MTDQVSGTGNPQIRNIPVPRLSDCGSAEHDHDPNYFATRENGNPKRYYEALCAFGEILDSGPKWSSKSTISVPFVDHEKKTLGEVWLHCTVHREWDVFRQTQFVECSTTDSREGGNPVNVTELTAWMYGVWEDGTNTTQETILNGNYVRTQRKTQNDFPFPHDPTQACGRGWSRGPTIGSPECCAG